MYTNRLGINLGINFIMINRTSSVVTVLTIDITRSVQNIYVLRDLRGGPQSLKSSNIT